MNIIFQTNINNGSLITKQGVIANNSGTSFKKTEKGEVIYLTNGNIISYGKLNNVKTIAFYIKSKTNTTIFSDGVTTNLQISSGSLSGQNKAIIDNIVVNTISFNKWHFCIVEFNTPINFTDFRIKATNNYFIGDIICSNILFTNTEKQQLYINYLNLYSIAKPVIFNPNLNILKPSEVKENNIALIASYNHNPISNKDINVAFDNPSNSNNARTFDRTLTKVQSIKDGTLWTTQSTSTSLNYGNIQSLRYIIKPKVLNQTLCKLNSSSNVNITSGGGIDVTGVSNEIVYINGSTNGVININTWNTISINFPTPINASSYVLGNLAYSGLVYDEKICKNQLSVEQIKSYHNQFASRVVLFEDFSQYPVHATRFGQWLAYKGFTLGNFRIDEVTTVDRYLPKGTKILRCNSTSTTTIKLQSNTAYGTWEFYMGRTNFTSGISIYFIDDGTTHSQSFRVLVNANSSQVMIYKAFTTVYTSSQPLVTGTFKIKITRLT